MSAHLDSGISYSSYSLALFFYGDELLLLGVLPLLPSAESSGNPGAISWHPGKSAVALAVVELAQARFNVDCCQFLGCRAPIV